MFVIDGEKYDDVEQQLTTARDRMLEIMKEHPHSIGPSGGGMEVSFITGGRLILTISSWVEGKWR